MSRLVHGRGAVREVGSLLPPRTRTVAVLHTATVSRYADAVAESCAASGRTVVRHVVADGECGKSLDEAARCWDALAAAGLTRSDLVVAVGGGALTDAAGFVASTWLRGVDWVAVPTTTLGMTDAAHGGKVALDTAAGKNLVGVFHEPLAVVIDPTTLATLSDRDVRAGLVEAVKCVWLVGDRVGDATGADRDELVLRAAQHKRALVAEDPREQGRRVLLNYGHTLGHAVEAASGYRLRHGEAVSIGMVYAAELGVRLGVTDPELPARHRGVLADLGVPLGWAGEWAELLPYLRQDKKRGPEGQRWVLLEREGAPRVVSGIDEQVCRQVLEAVRG